MTRILGLTFGGLLLSASLSFAGDLTVRDIMELHRSGLGEEVLIALIETDGGPFTLDLVDIQELKAEGIPERVIALMVRMRTRHATSVDTYADDEAEVFVEQDEPPSVVVQQQEVVTYVVPSIVIVPTAVPDHGERGDRRVRHRGERRDDDRSSGRVDRGRHDKANEPPPATWTTRQNDGRNVTSSGQVRRGVPPATWITPNPPRAASPVEKPARPRK